MAQPPESSSVPKSQRRISDVFDACEKLSPDGAAAVLLYARPFVEKDRRLPPTLQMVALWNFAWTVEVAAREMKDGVHRGGLVFIAAAYRYLRRRGDAAAMTLPAFKERCIEAHAHRIMMLETCSDAQGVHPLLLEASTTQTQRQTYHFIRRSVINNVRLALDQVLNNLPAAAEALVASYARKVHADEAIRDGRPRLITLAPEQFAARVQQIVDQESTDPSIVAIYYKLDDRGEMTGLDLDAFKARIVAAHRAGRLTLSDPQPRKGVESMLLPAHAAHEHHQGWSTVRRSIASPPIPWGPPARPILRKLVLHAP